ncbi:MAG: class I SAM-dependent methyltransferase [Proteobacteria bacterium]|nr:class I SAM-dependent methyltransferase [Pseudomonadota bacterium]
MSDRGYRIFYENLFLRILSSSPKNFFDEAALPSYTHKNRLMANLFWNRLWTAFSFVDDLKNKNVLDFGAGGGVSFKFLSERGANIYACEKEFYDLTEMVAKDLNLKIPVFKDIMDIENLKFDIVFALDVFEHIDNLEPILKKVKELSKNDTKLIISGPTESFIYKIGRFLAGFKGHYHVKNIYDIEKEVTESGFKLLKLKRLYPPITLFRISMWGF